MRLDINYKEKNCKKHKHLEITNNTCLNSQQVIEEIKREIKKISRNKWQWKHNSKPIGCNKSSSMREVNSNTILTQETRKTSNRQPNFTPKTTGKKWRTKKLVEGKKS